VQCLWRLVIHAESIGYIASNIHNVNLQNAMVLSINYHSASSWYAVFGLNCGVA
jgi:hypothetical protein